MQISEVGSGQPHRPNLGVAAAHGVEYVFGLPDGIEPALRSALTNLVSRSWMWSFVKRGEKIEGGKMKDEVWVVKISWLAISGILSTQRRGQYGEFE